MSLEDIVNRIAFNDKPVAYLLNQVKSYAEQIHRLGNDLDHNELTLRKLISELNQKVQGLNIELTNYYLYKKQDELLKQGDIPPDIKRKFMGLANALSPENLSMDGELSGLETARREKQLLNEWKALERQVGHKVTEDEVWRWHL